MITYEPSIKVGDLITCQTFDSYQPHTYALDYVDHHGVIIEHVQKEQHSRGYHVGIIKVYWFNEQRTASHRESLVGMSTTGRLIMTMSQSEFDPDIIPF